MNRLIMVDTGYAFAHMYWYMYMCRLYAYMHIYIYTVFFVLLIANNVYECVLIFQSIMQAFGEQVCWGQFMEVYLLA